MLICTFAYKCYSFLFYFLGVRSFVDVRQLTDDSLHNTLEGHSPEGADVGLRRQQLGVTLKLRKSKEVVAESGALSALILSPHDLLLGNYPKGLILLELVEFLYASTL